MCLATSNLHLANAIISLLMARSQGFEFSWSTAPRFRVARAEDDCARSSRLATNAGDIHRSSPTQGPFVVHRLQEEKFPLVKRFYSNQNYRSKVRGDDVVFVLRQESAESQSLRPGEIVGAVRMTKKVPIDKMKPNDLKPPMYLLQSLCIAESCRRNGLATRFLTADGPLLTLLNHEKALCYCFPYAPLVDLYRRAGFRVVEKTKEAYSIGSHAEQSPQLPGFIFAEYDMVSAQQARKKRPVVLMFRNPQQSGCSERYITNQSDLIRQKGSTFGLEVH